MAKAAMNEIGGSCSALSTWVAWPNQLAAMVRVRFMVIMVRGRARGGKGSLCPLPPPNTPNRPTWSPPPPPPRIAPLGPTPPPLLYPPPFALPKPPLQAPPPPQGASSQQLVGGVVGVQNRGVAPPPPRGPGAVVTGMHSSGSGPACSTNASAFPRFLTLAEDPGVRSRAVPSFLGGRRDAGRGIALPVKHHRPQ